MSKCSEKSRSLYLHPWWDTKKNNLCKQDVTNNQRISIKKNNQTAGGLHGVMVKALDCGIIVSEFELQSRYYIHLQRNTLGKGMNPFILPAMG